MKITRSGEESQPCWGHEPASSRTCHTPTQLSGLISCKYSFLPVPFPISASSANPCRWVRAEVGDFARDSSRSRGLTFSRHCEAVQDSERRLGGREFYTRPPCGASPCPSIPPPRSSCLLWVFLNHLLLNDIASLPILDPCLLMDNPGSASAWPTYCIHLVHCRVWRLARNFYLCPLVLASLRVSVPDFLPLQVDPMDLSGLTGWEAVPVIVPG